MNEYDSYSYHVFQANAHATCNYDFAHPRYCRAVDAILPQLTRLLFCVIILRRDQAWPEGLPVPI